jgi:hypothetical protein
MATGAAAPTTPWGRFGEFERTYLGGEWIEFCRNHAEAGLHKLNSVDPY